MNALMLLSWGGACVLAGVALASLIRLRERSVPGGIVPIGGGDVILTKIVPASGSGSVLFVDLLRDADERGVVYLIGAVEHPGGYTFPPYVLRDPVDVMVRWMEVTGDVLDCRIFEESA